MSAVKITEKEGQSLIENFVKSQKVKFIKYELSPISEVAEGYMGEHYNLRATYLQDGKAQTADFFMKHTPTKNKHQAEIANGSNIYAREIFLYDFLFKEFKNFGFDVSFAAESFYCIPNKAIIMENLKIKGYTTLERDANFTEDELKCALRALASYHGAGFAYQKTKSLQLGRNYKLTDDYDEYLSENFFIQYIPNPRNKAGETFWAGCKRTLHTLVDLLPQDEQAKTKFKTHLTNFKLGKIFAESTKHAKTLGHGDLWSNNILFRMDDGDNGSAKPVACCLCDYQVLRYFYPSFDVMLVIYSNTDNEFRRQHFRELCDYYYDTLTEIYHTCGFQLKDIMPKEDYEKTFEMLKIDMLFQVACVRAITCIPKEILDEKSKCDGDFQEAFFDNYKISAKAFQESTIFRKILTELLIELYDTFEAYKTDLS